MATRSTFTLEDDLDGGPADETVRFGLGSMNYELDLSTTNAKAFREQLAPFIGRARKTGRSQLARPLRTAKDRRNSADVRAWARQQGIKVNERGRIPDAVAEQYRAAMAGRGRR